MEGVSDRSPSCISGIVSVILFSKMKFHIKRDMGEMNELIKDIIKHGK